MKKLTIEIKIKEIIKAASEEEVNRIIMPQWDSARRQVNKRFESLAQKYAQQIADAALDKITLKKEKKNG